jgi:pimeloyl-ACP methyl ester carboxylesterase
VLRSWYLLVFAAALCAVAFGLRSASAAPPRTVVVLVGGLGSTAAGNVANFGPLVGQLVTRGYGVRSFYYGADVDAPSPAAAWAAYTSELSCQSIDTSTAELADFVRGLRSSGQVDSVMLVGHSNGGVIALGVPAAAPDLAPFIRRVVTIDSPVGGLEVGQAFALGAHDGPCQAGDELYARRSDAGWPDYLAQLVAWERGQGIDVAAVVNPEDWYVSVDEQQLPAEVNVSIDATGSSANHAAVLHAPEALAQLVAIVSAP